MTPFTTQIPTALKQIIGSDLQYRTLIQTVKEQINSNTDMHNSSKLKREKHRQSYNHKGTRVNSWQPHLPCPQSEFSREGDMAKVGYLYEYALAHLLFILCTGFLNYNWCWYGSLLWPWLWQIKWVIMKMTFSSSSLTMPLLASCWGVEERGWWTTEDDSMPGGPGRMPRRSFTDSFRTSGTEALNNMQTDSHTMQIIITYDIISNQLCKNNTNIKLEESNGHLIVKYNLEKISKKRLSLYPCQQPP